MLPDSSTTNATTADAGKSNCGGAFLVVKFLTDWPLRRGRPLFGCGHCSKSQNKKACRHTYIIPTLDYQEAEETSLFQQIRICSSLHTTQWIPMLLKQGCHCPARRNLSGCSGHGRTQLQVLSTNVCLLLSLGGHVYTPLHIIHELYERLAYG